MQSDTVVRPLFAALLFAAALSDIHASVTSLRIDDRAGRTGEFYYFAPGSGSIDDSAEEPSTPGQVGLEATSPHLTGWSLRFRAPSGQVLAPGRYDVPLYPGPADPEIRVYPAYYGWCYGGPATFSVHQVEFKPAGSLSAFWAAFEISCGPSTLTGEVRFNADADTEVVLQAPARAIGVEGHALSLPIAGHDPGGGPATLEAIGAPAGASFVDAGDGTGTLSFTPAPGQAGRTWIQWIARTLNGASDTAWTLLDVFPDFDDFDHPVRFSTLPYLGVFDGPPLTASPADPDCGPSGLLTAWFEYTPEEDGRVQFYMDREAGGPLYYISAYEDENGRLRPLGCSSWNIVRPDVLAGHTYRLLVGLPAPSSYFIVRADPLPTPPANDARAQATVIAALPFHDEIEAGGASPDFSDPPVCTSPSLRNPSVWYAYTPAADMLVTVDIPYDETTLFRGPIDALVYMACGYQSPISFRARAGETYHVMTSQPMFPLSWPIAVNVTGRPAFGFQIAIQPAGTLDQRTGVAHVQGMVSCAQPARLHLEGEVRQVGAASAFSLEVDCDGPTSWSAAVAPAAAGAGRRSPGFRKGPAEVVLEASGAPLNDPENAATREERGRVLLRPARAR